MTEHQGKGTTDFDRLVMELEGIAKQERELYSDAVIQEAHHPSNLGRMARPDVHGLVHG